MFDLLDRPLHWITVKWPGLSQSEDESKLSEETEHAVELRVELLDREEVQQIFPAAFGLEQEPPSELEIFKRVTKEWRKVVVRGRAAPFDDEHIGLMLKVPMFAAAFTAAYLKAIGGRVEIREGNSQSSPSDGRADGQA